MRCIQSWASQIVHQLSIGIRWFCLITFSFCLTTFTPTLPAEAVTSIELTHLSYYPCPAKIGQGAVTSGGSAQAANCFFITGTAINPSGKPLYDADVFGRVYDATGNPAIQNRTRLGSIEAVPAGESPFKLRISVPAGQPEPLQLEQFKATGFSSPVTFKLF